MMNHSRAAVAMARMAAHAALLVVPPGRRCQSHWYMWCLPLLAVVAGARRLGVERAEHDDAVRAGPRGIAGDQGDHRFMGVLAWPTGNRVQDRGVAGQDKLGVGD